MTMHRLAHLRWRLARRLADALRRLALRIQWSAGVPWHADCPRCNPALLDLTDQEAEDFARGMEDP